MKIVFMGTPEFALPSLRALAESEQDVAAVVTHEDKPRGRRLVLSPPPVKELAAELNLRVLQPPRLSEKAFIEEIKKIGPDLIAVVAFGRFLPRDLWELPSSGAINLHPSLLPKYRGAAPIQRAILNGESETGVTIMYLSEEMDAGDIIKQEKAQIRPGDTSASLSERLSENGAQLLLASVRDIERGVADRKPQDGSKATMAPKIKKAEGLIDWNVPAKEIELRVRAFYPWPSAYTYFPYHARKMLLKVLEAGVDPDGGGEAGKVISCSAGGISVGTGKGCLVVRRLQPEGKRAMTAAEFAAGHRELAGIKLG